MKNTLQVTKQDAESVRNIIVKHGATKGSKVKIIPTGSQFAKSFDVLVNDVLFCKYFGTSTTNTGRANTTYILA